MRLIIAGSVIVVRPDSARQCLECLPTIQWRLQLWDAVSSWRQRLHFPIDGRLRTVLQGLHIAASQNAAPYSVDTGHRSGTHVRCRMVNLKF